MQAAPPRGSCRLSRPAAPRHRRGRPVARSGSWGRGRPPGEPLQPRGERTACCPTTTASCRKISFLKLHQIPTAPISSARSPFVDRCLTMTATSAFGSEAPRLLLSFQHASNCQTVGRLPRLTAGTVTPDPDSGNFHTHTNTHRDHIGFSRQLHQSC